MTANANQILEAKAITTWKLQMQDVQGDASEVVKLLSGVLFCEPAGPNRPDGGGGRQSNTNPVVMLRLLAC